MTGAALSFLAALAGVLDCGPVKTPFPATHHVDAGSAIEASCAELKSPYSRWYCSTPAKLTVSVAEDAEGRVGLHEVYRGDDLPPAFAGESLFVTWPKVKSRHWFFRFEEGGTRAIVRSGQYMNWAGFRIRSAWGWPNNKDGKFKDIIDLANLRLHAVIPSEAPQGVRPRDQAFDEPRLLKDWLMRDFGLDAWTNSLDKASDAAYLATNAERRRKRLTALSRQATQFVYVRRKYALGGDAELHGTAMVSDEPVAGIPMNFRKGAELCLLTIRPDGTISNEVLVARPQGMIRDPDLSHDGKTLVFAMRATFNENEFVRRRHDIDRKQGEPTRGSGFPAEFYDKLEGDDYHLYTLDLTSRSLKQITFSDPARCADFEPCWTSAGDIIFQSSRCEQVIPCHQTMAVNLYACRADGTEIRRLAADGGCTSNPRELPDGRILYTRYEYNDRSARLNQPLFSMNPDGTLQKEVYGNGSAFPTSLIHFRPMPGSAKLIGIVSGHHVHQQGKLVELDPSCGFAGDSGLTFIAGSDYEEKGLLVKSHYERDPRMTTRGEPDSLDFATQTGAQWQYPYPLNDGSFLVSFLPEGTLAIKGSSGPHFGVYWQNRDGDRELLAHDPDWECVQAVPVCPRKRAFARPSRRPDPSAAFGVFDISDVYDSEVLAGVRRGEVKRLRVVAIESRPTYTYSCAMPWPADALFSRFIAYGGDHSGEALNAGGTWDVKHVLGEVDVMEDGSCTFRCPAKNPVYFQLLDARGRTIQTMRSWTHLQAGERASCVGCHENKRHSASPTPTHRLTRTVQRLRPSAGLPQHPLLARLEMRGGLLASPDNLLGVHGWRSTDPEARTEGFSYRQIVQPILNRRCVACHDGQGAAAKRPNLTAAVANDFRPEAHRNFTVSYRTLTREGRQTAFSSWYSSGGICEPLPPYAQGSSVSELMDYLEPSHHGVAVTDDEKRAIACWLDLGIPFGGSYPEATVWNDSDRRTYAYHQDKRLAFARHEIDECLGNRTSERTPEEVFCDPPHEAAVGVWWHWMGGQVSEDGVRKDLAWFKRMGIGYATIFGMADSTSPWARRIGNVPTGIHPYSDAWWRLVKVACSEGRRLGIDIGLHNCPGYTSTGGKWITPSLGMRELVFDVTNAVEQVSQTPTARFPVYDEDAKCIRRPPLPARQTDVVEIGVARGVRVAHIPMGAFVQPTDWDSFGLECDKMSSEAVAFHMDHVIAEFKRHLGDDLPAAGLRHVLLDSYEAGEPTWTPKMREEFQARRGYDPLEFLPILGGYTNLYTAAEVKRFKADFDRTRKDLYRDVLFRIMSEKLHAEGLEFSCEPYWGPFEPEEVSPFIDRLMCEFWNGGHKGAGMRSVTHKWQGFAAPGGRKHNVIEAEAFTGDPRRDGCVWTETPATLKASTDDAFLSYVNRFMLHTNPLQPWGDEIRPGVTMGQWGTHFGRTQTWAECGKCWFDYCRRCQALLQWGRLSGARLNVPLSQLSRESGGRTIFFLVNRSPTNIVMNLCGKWYEPMTGRIGAPPHILAPRQSGFFERGEQAPLPPMMQVAELNGFEPRLGDWTLSSDPDVKYFSGTKTYRASFDLPRTADAAGRFAIDLGDGLDQVLCVRVNGRDVGTAWCAPWQVEIPHGILKTAGNQIEVAVTNPWMNRLIGDEQEPADCQFVKSSGYGKMLGCYPDWFAKGLANRPSRKRHCFVTWNYFTKDSPLQPAGLVGPVRLLAEQNGAVQGR